MVRGSRAASQRRALIEKLARVEDDISSERGAFTLFALFERDDLPSRLDLVISAPWAGANRHESRCYVIEHVKRHLDDEDLVQLALVVVLDISDEPVRVITESIDVEHGRVLIRDVDSLGLPVRKGYVITSKRAA